MMAGFLKIFEIQSGFIHECNMQYRYNKNNIRVIIKNQNEQYSIGTTKGMMVARIDMKDFSLSVADNIYIKDDLVTCIVEVALNVNVVNSVKKCAYYYVDLATKAEHLITRGTGKY